MKKRTIAFLISDLQDEGFGEMLKRTARKHDLVALQVTDDLEMQAAKMGWLAAADAESGRNLLYRLIFCALAQAI